MKSIGSAQSAIKKNYETRETSWQSAMLLKKTWHVQVAHPHVINRIRSLAMKLRRKQQACNLVRATSNKPQAASVKLQAPSLKHQAIQRSWSRIHNPSTKLQASSHKQQALLYLSLHKVLGPWNRHLELG